MVDRGPWSGRRTAEEGRAENQSRSGWASTAQYPYSTAEDTEGLHSIVDDHQNSLDLHDRAGRAIDNHSGAEDPQGRSGGTGDHHG